MTVKIDGNVPPVAWCNTGLWTLDNIALSDLNNTGIPLRSFIELFGHPESGKSTLAYFMSGKVTAQGDVVIADLEANMNPEYAISCFNQAGLDGNLRVIDYVDKNFEPRPHEKILQEMTKGFRDPDVGALILDSIGMITPITEKKSDFGTKKIGARAQLVADLMRDFVAWLRSTQRPKIIIGVNHSLNPIGGRGYITPGGDTKNYAANVRIRMYRLGGQDVFDDGSFCAECSVQKHKYGGTHKNRKGLVFIIPQIGVSPELTAMYDCFQMGLATRDTTVKMGGKSMGYIQKKFIEGAKNGKKEIFDPFFEALGAIELEAVDYDEEE
jgi:RecA/RadA recombinase